MRLIALLLILVLASAESCQKDEDCAKYYFCNAGNCKHKHLFPLEGMEILGTVLVFVCSALANAAGQGGGPLMSLILLVLFNYDTYVALPMVQLIILGGSGIGFILRVPMRHPTRPRPVIDYYILALFTPPLLVGASIGVILGLIFPAWLILALLTLVLIYITYASATVSVKIYRKENAERAKVAEQNLIAEDEDKPTIVDESSIEITPDLKKIIDSEKRWFPFVPIFIFILVYSFAVFTSFLRGSSNHPSIIGVTQCTPAYWIMNLLIFAGFGVFTILVTCYIVYNTKKKVNLGYNFDSYDIIWKCKPLTICIIFGLLAGIGASLLSFGGALILAPVMLKIGLRPEVSAGTSTAIIVLTASISIIQYAIAGKLEMVYGLWFFGFSLLGSAIGISVVKGIVNKFKRGSIMVIVLTILMGLCAILIPAYGIVDMASKGTTDIGFRPYCS
ncbi:hypothetical protein SteCoe_15702 [Stentor coeruleus]|uniref:Membrane transporter protein n=1 Tax=Stentor coeruleus TaxID=5963 RepID=A0A1R2C2W2_9CILI|nr:hypothetical protein SteCoe_15702 [Stentor coeruleus]